MTSNKGKIFFFLSGSVLYNDKVMPVILELARQGNRVDTVVWNHHGHNYLTLGGAYHGWLKKFTHIRKLNAKKSRAFLYRTLLYFRYLCLWLEMRFRRNYIAFFDAKGKTRITAPLNSLAKKRGKSIIYSPDYVDFWKGLDWNAVLSNEAYRQKLGKTTNNNEKIPSLDCDSLLIYNKELTNQLANHGKNIRFKEYCVVPHPKMQKWWELFVEAHPPAYDEPELGRLDRWISLFITHRGNYLFRKDSDVDVLLKEILLSIRAIFPDVPIVLKPKITLDTQWLKEYVGKLGIKALYISEAPISLLAKKSLVGITTGHTTGQFEFVGTKAPWIEYCRYSDFWKEIYPRLTYTRDYGGWWVETPEELRNLLVQVKKGDLKADREKWKKQINFFPREISFSFFAGAGAEQAACDLPIAAQREPISR